MSLYNPEEVVKYIQEFKSKGVKVYLHHPSRYKGQYLDIISSSQEMRELLRLVLSGVSHDL